LANNRTASGTYNVSIMLDAVASRHISGDFEYTSNGYAEQIECLVLEACQPEKNDCWDGVENAKEKSGSESGFIKVDVGIRLCSHCCRIW